MPVTSLSATGYGLLKDSLRPGEVEALKKELTMVPVSTMGPAGGAQAPAAQATEFPLFLESRSKLYVPKYFGLKRYGAPASDKLSDGAAIDVPFAGSLRDEQKGPVDAYVAAARDRRRMGGIISLPCGGGKTITALYILSLLGRKALIIVHKDFLLNQWKERIREFLPSARVGLLKAKVVDVADRDIVLASLQSLSMKTYDASVLADVGFVIVDECHRVGTEVFSRALHKVNFRYSLGLSATVNRKDGMTKAFVHFLGDVVFKAKRRSDVVRVVQMRFRDASDEYCREELIGSPFNSKPNVSRMINNICAFEPRNRLIVDTIAAVVAREPGRKVLVLSDRKRQLTRVREGVEAAGLTAGYYWGGMKPHELAESETKRVMCATFAYAAEGMDVPDLDTLFMVSPKSDIEQSCGRILRQKAEARQRTPLIVDVVDCFSLFERQARKRAQFYKKHGYTVVPSLSGDDGQEGSADPGDDDDDDACAGGGKPAVCAFVGDL
jgi:superfamily II DNA or RNA helicase